MTGISELNITTLLDLVINSLINSPGNGKDYQNLLALSWKDLQKALSILKFMLEIQVPFVTHKYPLLWQVIPKGSIYSLSMVLIIHCPSNEFLHLLYFDSGIFIWNSVYNFSSNLQSRCRVKLKFLNCPKMDFTFIYI